MSPGTFEYVVASLTAFGSMWFALARDFQTMWFLVILTNVLVNRAEIKSHRCNQ